MKELLMAVFLVFSSIFVIAQDNEKTIRIDVLEKKEVNNLSYPPRSIDLNLRLLVLKSLTDKSYLFDGKRLKNFPALSPYLADNVIYGEDFRHAISTRNQTKVLAMLTGIVFVGSLIEIRLTTGGPPVGLGEVGLLIGAPTLSLLTLIAGARYISKRTKVEKLFLMTYFGKKHNTISNNFASLNLSLTQNGIGLVINF